MPNYRRVFIPGGIWFFTLNLLERHGNDLLVRAIYAYVRRVQDCPSYATFHRDVAAGIYPQDWCDDPDILDGGDE